MTTFGGVPPAAIITSRIAASVSGDGLKFPKRYPTAIERGVQSNLSGLFHTSMRAPFPAKKDGVLRHHAARRDGTARDTVVYSILPEEWPDVRDRLERRLARYS